MAAALSTTWIVKLNVPVAVGEPDSATELLVDEPSVRPAGSVPAETLQVNPGVPFTQTIVSL
jgi:hypothetical protein